MNANQERMKDVATRIAAELKRCVIEGVPINAIQFGFACEGDDDIRVIGGGAMQESQEIIKLLAHKLANAEIVND